MNTLLILLSIIVVLLLILWLFVRKVKKKKKENDLKEIETIKKEAVKENEEDLNNIAQEVARSYVHGD